MLLVIDWGKKMIHTNHLLHIWHGCSDFISKTGAYCTSPERLALPEKGRLTTMSVLSIPMASVSSVKEYVVNS